MKSYEVNYETKMVSVELIDGSSYSFTAECDVYDDYALACEVRERIFGQ